METPSFTFRLERVRSLRESAEDAAREALARAEREHAERLAQQQAAERRSAARTSHREALQRERAALTAELEQARGGAPSVAERATALQRRTALLTEAADAARRAQETGRRVEEADAQLAGAAARAGFDRPASAEAALLGEVELRGLEAQLVPTAR